MNEQQGLQLRHLGWRRIDSAALHVSGKLDAVVFEMNAVLNDSVVTSLCSTLGILVTGFFFIDPVKKYTKFFNNQNDGQSTYRTQYIWTDRAMGDLWSEAVHGLFVQLRTAQQRENPDLDVRTEEYFRYLPEVDRTADPFQETNRILITEQSILYVSLGETLFTILAWRLLLAANISGDPFARSEDPVPLRWKNVDLFDITASDDTVNAVRNLWQLVCKRAPDITALWRLLSLESAGVDDPATNRWALSAFLGRLSSFHPSYYYAMTDRELIMSVLECIPQFLSVLDPASHCRSLQEQFAAIESIARFPIIPFYAWHVMDPGPKCYWVSPVWTSQQYSVFIDGKECRHLGLALSAVKPISEIDWTLRLFEGEGQIEYMRSDPVVIANVLRLMARPLVEEHLYNSAVRAQIESLKERLRSKVVRYIGSRRPRKPTGSIGGPS